jgi:aspartyl-tRNA(Asn)/glutamyl-tRNA(Gln) amidotransferase subunit A
MREVVRKLRAAAAVMLGKANMNEFAAGVAGSTSSTATRESLGRRPLVGRLVERRAVAVSAGLALGGLGSDTGVSIRGPASLAGPRRRASLVMGA